MNIFKRFTRCLALATLIHAAPAHTAYLTFDFSGTITDSPDGMVTTGTHFSGRFSYDSATDAVISDDSTIYSPVVFSLIIDGEKIDFSAVANVNNDSATTYAGSDIVQIGSANIMPAIEFNGFDIHGIEINLFDFSGTALSDETLPTSFNLSAWSSIGRTLAIRNRNSTDITHGTIETLTSVVPIPAAVLLFLSGIAGLSGLVWMKG